MAEKKRKPVRKKKPEKERGKTAPKKKVSRAKTLLQAVREIDERNQGKRLTPGDETQALLREARDGGMYGWDQLEPHGMEDPREYF